MRKSIDQWKADITSAMFDLILSHVSLCKRFPKPAKSAHEAGGQKKVSGSRGGAQSQRLIGVGGTGRAEQASPTFAGFCIACGPAWRFSFFCKVLASDDAPQCS